MKEPRILEYEKMGLGLFIHWGLFSLLHQGEWTEYIHKLDKKKYEKLIEQFQAQNFNPLEIARTAKKMGCKYIVLTAKHHEGFHLYNTNGLTKFDSIHSKANRDLISEFVTACNQENIKPFLYMATYDWHNLDYVNNFDNYLDYFKQSVKILCTRYGKIGGFWFDGNWDKPNANWKLNELYSVIRKYQPEAIIVNNTGLKKQGIVVNKEIDVVTYERGIPNKINHGKSKYVAGEISLTLNQHWGIATNDINYKSPKEIIENIVHSKKIGSNILINIGLNGDGSITDIDKCYMSLIGKWVNLYSDALYRGQPDKIYYSTNNKDFGIQFNDTIYFFIHNLKIVGNSNVVLGGEEVNPKVFLDISEKIKDIEWVDNQEHLSFTQDKNKKYLTFDATGYRYGSSYIVRVAKAKLNNEFRTKV